MNAILTYILTLAHQYGHDGREMTFYTTHHLVVSATSQQVSWVRDVQVWLSGGEGLCLATKHTHVVVESDDVWGLSLTLLE